VQLGYGVWMFCAVLIWDLCIARAAGHPPVVRRFMAHVRKVERVTGVVLLGIAAGIVGAR
jgi:cytochrome c biogenesis protein CcdA